MLNRYQTNAVAADHWFSAHDTDIESSLTQFCKVHEYFVMSLAFVQCSLGTKQKPYLTNQFRIRSILKFNYRLYFCTYILFWGVKEEKDYYNFDTKHLGEEI